MRRRRRSRFRVRATRAKKRQTLEEEEDDDVVSLSDADIIGSDEGPSSLNVSDKQQSIILEKEKEKEGMRRMDNKGKGKVEVSESDSEEDSSDESSDDLFSEDITTDESDTSDSDQCVVGRGKKNVLKKVNANKGKKKKGEKNGKEKKPVRKQAVIGNMEPEEEVRIGHLEQAVIDNRARLQGKCKKHRGRKGEVRPALLWEIWEDENELWVNDNLNADIDLVSQDEVMKATEPSSDLLLPLLRYQKEWLYWALKQEESVNRGGILADEMGMGKTIQAIALVLARRAISQSGCGTSGSSCSRGLSTRLPQVKCTLVVCPVVAVIQWVNEIARFTAEGSTKVLVYHGSNRIKNIDQFSEYDFVLTTYSTIEADYRMNMMPPKEACIWCGKMYYPNRMAVHLKYFCGPNAVRTEKQSKQFKKGGTNRSKYSKMKDVAVEVKDIQHQKSKGKGPQKKTKKQGNLEKIPGINSPKYTKASEDHDSPTKKSVLHSVKWNRIILDEAHFIKDRRSNTARAVLALESSYKWALSGTPLQNRVGELYSLVRFLQVTPYSYYFCKDCDCKSLDYSSSKQCSNCIHSSVRHFCWWNRFVAKPIQSSGNGNEGRRAMILLKHKLLKSIVLRRTKKGRAADLALPPRIVTLRRDTLDIKEEDYYESLHSESQLQFNTYVESGTLMNNYAHIFDLLTRLRQAVDHPYLVIYSKAAALKNEINGNISEQECGICHDPAEDPVVASCTHVFCKACLTDYSAALGHVSCPTCSKPLTADFTSKISVGDQSTKTTVTGFRSSSILNKISLEDFQTSTKIDALREEIRFMIERDGSAKAIVFSQFTSFLDLIHYSLQKSGINCVQLVGSMTMGARDVAIQKFTNDPDCKIFLMSLKAGGVALNLTVASQVFLMDPWWNPAVERQAQDRIHRIGQYKPIRIVRFVIENTIEERILKLQEKKELVFEGTVGGSSEALVKLTEADLRFLFAS